MVVVYNLVLDCKGHGIRLAQNTTQTLIGDQLKSAPVFIDDSARSMFSSE